MEIASQFPTRVVVRVAPTCPPGLAVRLSFKMNTKNDFHYLFFAGADSSCEVSGKELLRAFDVERNFYIMDYGNARNCFTSKITATVLSEDDVNQVLELHKTHRSIYQFPVNYEINLQTAQKLGSRQNPARYSVRIEPYDDFGPSVSTPDEE